MSVPIPDIHYGSLLEQELSKLYTEVNVINQGKYANTIIGVFETLSDYLSDYQPDLVIMQVGIVDAWSRLELNGNPKVEIDRFTDHYNKIMEILKETNQTKVIIIGICPTSRKKESKYKGTLERISKYNQILMSGSDQKQIYYVDMEKHIDIDLPEIYLMPDDHHLNPNGNKLVFNLILEQLIKMEILESDS